MDNNMDMTDEEIERQSRELTDYVTRLFDAYHRQRTVLAAIYLHLKDQDALHLLPALTRDRLERLVGASTQAEDSEGPAGAGGGGEG